MILIETLKELLSKGTKNILAIIILTVAIILSISPIFILVFMYNLDINNNPYPILIMFIIIVSCISFFLIFIITCLGNIKKLKNMDNSIYIISNISYTVLKTTILSGILLVAYIILNYYNIDEQIKVAVSIVLFYIIGILIYSFIKWIAYLFNKEERVKELNKKFNELNKRLNELREKYKTKDIENKKLTEENKRLKELLNKNNNSKEGSN